MVALILYQSINCFRPFKFSLHMRCSDSSKQKTFYFKHEQHMFSVQAGQSMFLFALETAYSCFLAAGFVELDRETENKNMQQVSCHSFRCFLRGGLIYTNVLKYVVQRL